MYLTTPLPVIRCWSKKYEILKYGCQCCQTVFNWWKYMLMGDIHFLALVWKLDFKKLARVIPDANFVHLGRREFASRMTRGDFLKTSQNIGLGVFLSHHISPWYMHAKSDVDLSWIKEIVKITEYSIQGRSRILSHFKRAHYYTAPLLHIVTGAGKLVF